MPARWQSSQRPLFVRTVWMNGLRHAILSADDPLFRCRSPAVSNSASRPGSCSSVGTFMTSSSGSSQSCDLEPCLIKLQLVLASNKSPASSSHRSSSCRSRHDNKPVCVQSQDSEGGASMVREYQSYVFPSSSDEEPEQESVDDDRYLFSDVEYLLPNLQLNPLSERVLQWLHLVGKTSGIVDGTEHIASVPRCGNGNGKERSPPRYISTSAPRPPSEVPVDRRYASKGTLQRQRNVHMPRMLMKTHHINTPLEEDPLHVIVRGKHETFENVRAGIDETVVRCASPGTDDVSAPTLRQLSSAGSVTSPPVVSGTIRPQLHIFMPTVRRDRPTLRHQDAADDVSDNECSSCCSEASS
jgi:hypothetical protein